MSGPAASGINNEGRMDMVQGNAIPFIAPLVILSCHSGIRKALYLPFAIGDLIGLMASRISDEGG